MWGKCNPDDMSSYGMGIPVAEARVGATWYDGPVIQWPETTANAHLIAAARKGKAMTPEQQHARDVNRAIKWSLATFLILTSVIVAVVITGGE